MSWENELKCIEVFSEYLFSDKKNEFINSYNKSNI